MASLTLTRWLTETRRDYRRNLFSRFSRHNEDVADRARFGPSRGPLTLGPCTPKTISISDCLAPQPQACLILALPFGFRFGFPPARRPGYISRDDD